MTDIKKMIIILKYIMKHPVNRMQIPVLITAAVIALIALCSYWLPAYLSHTDVINKIIKTRDMIRVSRNSQTINDAFALSSDTADAIQKKLLSKASTGGIISKINELARQNKLSLSIENSDSKEEMPRGYELSVLDISARGSYQGFRYFIAGLEKLDSMVVLRRIKIEREARSGGMIKAAVKTAIYKKTAAGDGIK